MSSSSSITGNKAPIAATQAGATNPSGNLEPLLVDGSGNLLVAGTFTGSSASVGPTGSAVPADADYAGGNYGGTLVGIKVASDGSVITTLPDVVATGAITSTQTVDLLCDGLGSAGIQITGTWTGFISFYSSVDGTNFSATNAIVLNTGALIGAVTANGIWTIQCAGMKYVRAAGSSVATGSATVTIRGNQGVSSVMLDNPIPTGTNTIGNIGQINSALPAGTAILGKVGIDQTTPGTTNGVQVNAALPAGTNVIGHVIVDAGSAVIGKVSIDQTTPGTTNGVQVNAALPAGSAIIGKMGIDQTTPGTTNGVQVNAALPVGANVIGKVSIDQTTPGTTNLVALAANQSVNVAQINGMAPLMGAGNTGTGSPRVTIATDQATLPTQVVTSSSSTNANSSLASTALEASHVIKASAGRLFQLTGVNTKTSAQYIQVFNSTTVPADTTAPVLLAYVPAGATFSWDFGDVGRYFSTGIAVSNSSTAATKTIGSADCWFNAEYL
jgi:hypothetical protein